MSNPNQVNPYMNQTEANMYLNNPNVKPALVPAQNPVYVPVTPGQPVPMGVPVQPQPSPQMVAPTPYPVQSVQSSYNGPQVIVVNEEITSSRGCCYCRGPRQSPCGCLDPNKDYCCFLVVMAYVLMSLRYILMCLCIWSYCRSFNRGGWC